MKIKRYLAPDIRQAIRMVRDEQGPDAVILSNRRVDEGVEILAAADYDEAALKEYAAVADKEKRESQPARRDGEAVREVDVEAYRREQVPARGAQDPVLAEMRRELKMLRGIVEDQLSELVWRDFSRQSPLHADLIRRFVDLGLSAELARQIVKEVPASDDVDRAWQDARGALGRHLPLASDDILASGGVVALVGPTGVGKTTTVAKLAARYALRYGVRHIALVTTDNYRVAAHEQLRTYGRLLDVSVRVVGDGKELARTLDDLADKDLVLVDTAGMSQRDMRLSEQLSMLRGAASRIKTYLVLAATTSASGLDEVVRAFQHVDLEGCIVTKADEATVLGAVLGTLIKHGLPAVYISDGQRVPEDLHLARADNLIARAVALLTQRNDDFNKRQSALPTERTAANAY